MRRAHTVPQVRDAEADLMRSLPDGVLMQRAATGLAHAVLDLLGGGYGHRVLLLVGSGDNGGDALYAGCALLRRGSRVAAVLLGGSHHEEGLAAFTAAGGTVVDDVADAPRPDVVVDGIVGIGGRPGLRPEAVAALAALAGVPVVAVDVPSGVDVDTGELDGPHVVADLTVTFGTHKVAHLVGPAAGVCGAVHLVDLGLELPAAVVESLQPEDVAALVPRPGPDDHKYTRGVVGVRAGSETYPGAALLCVAGASSGLVGMVRYVGSAADRVRAAHPEVVGDGRVQAWVVGPGGGDEAAEQLAAAVGSGVPVLVDADGLAHVRPGQAAVLTPHAGELARMLDTAREDVEARPLAHARLAAETVRRGAAAQGSAHARGGAGRPDARHDHRPALAGDRRCRRRPVRPDRRVAGRRSRSVGRRVGGLVAARRRRDAGVGRRAAGGGRRRGGAARRGAVPAVTGVG